VPEVSESCMHRIPHLWFVRHIENGGEQIATGSKVLQSPHGSRRGDELVTGGQHGIRNLRPEAAGGSGDQPNTLGHRLPLFVMCPATPAHREPCRTSRARRER
jgi:hypothetical protein